MYALVEIGMQLFRRKNYQDFSDIDALAVSMSEKFFAQLSFKKARLPFFSENVTYAFLPEPSLRVTMRLKVFGYLLSAQK